MIDLHPEVLSQNGEMEFVVLPYEEFVELQTFLAHAEDLMALQAAKVEEQAAPRSRWDKPSSCSDFDSEVAAAKEHWSQRDLAAEHGLDET